MTENKNDNKSIIARVLEWLNADYTENVPMPDMAAVMAILRHKLDDEQLTEVVRLLLQARSARGEEFVSDSQINEYIRKVVDQVPTAADIDRVAKILGAYGLKIAKIHINPDTAKTSKYVKYKNPDAYEIALAESAAAGLEPNT